MSLNIKYITNLILEAAKDSTLPPSHSKLIKFGFKLDSHQENPNYPNFYNSIYKKDDDELRVQSNRNYKTANSFKHYKNGVLVATKNNPTTPSGYWNDVELEREYGPVEVIPARLNTNAHKFLLDNGYTHTGTKNAIRDHFNSYNNGKYIVHTLHSTGASNKFQSNINHWMQTDLNDNQLDSGDDFEDLKDKILNQNRNI